METKKRRKGLIKNSVYFVGNYLPRKCGIATFTTDLSNAIAKHGRVKINVVAMNDTIDGYNYPDTVKFEIYQNDQLKYSEAGDFINIANPEIINLQHEFGIFGGPGGDYISILLKKLNMPIITTLHTILKKPNEEYMKSYHDLFKYSDRIVVLSKKALQMSKDIYGLGDDKVVYIPHGIPDIPFVDTSFYKDEFHLSGKKILITFGLINPGKGIEYVIKALPEVKKKFPNIVYIVLGATHPNIKKISGEEYRLSLKKLAEDLNVENNVLFLNKFISLEDLTKFLMASDIYITPYLNEEQVVSGTLAYALGAGKAIISTPYWYAVELLDDDRGKIVDFRDSNSIARAILEYLEDEVSMNLARKRAYQYGRSMIWKNVARAYLDVFHDVLKRRNIATVQEKDKKRIMKTNYPEPTLKHLIRMTDDTGLLQHSSGSIPDRKHGYCLDDNARAIVVATKYYNLVGDKKAIDLLDRYLSFVVYMQRMDGRFHNFLGYNREYLDETGSDDSFGRALWGLGYAMKYAPDWITPVAKNNFDRALPHIEELNLRGSALALIGLYYYNKRFPGATSIRKGIKLLADKIVHLYKTQSSPDWQWFEPVLAYSNGFVPKSLMLAYDIVVNVEYINTALESMEFLINETFKNGFLSLIGSNGWYKKGNKRVNFDQQPVDAMATIEMLRTAYAIYKKPEYLIKMKTAFNWFLGLNDKNTSMYDFRTGGCSDGLTPNGKSLNQGAESLLAYMLSLLDVIQLT
ncbi:MAG: glycosyltransferase, partial [Proteobacteria bacterium]|nr:glycosyltransferase [Pseudomonadota bacterium]